MSHTIVQLTKACSYQQVFYTLNCTNTVTGSVIQKGSRSHTEPNNNIVKITLDDVDQDQLYRCVVLIEVGSGSTVSKTTTFSKDMNILISLCMSVL